ncbi:hypothetical protein DKX38_011409 [Salix brachista]|uniref:Ubiquitin-like domain-containing protein n=1 Tax=Salix brachista TaxID=2182728 RepID=A0A5N5M1B7_9ROSI|nr:hypothetical protein DKX38_011409 [Salix brachista]
MTDGRGFAENRFNKEKERLVGHKKTKASNDPNKQNLSRSPRLNGPQEGEKGNLAEGRQSKLISAYLVPASGDKGKEKVEGYGMNTKHDHISQTMVEGPRSIPHPDPLQLRSSAHNGYNDGSIMIHQPVERNLGPEPPDEAERMDEGGTLGVENDKGEGQGTPAEKIAGEIQLSANKQKLSGKAGFLKDNMSLAYYNIGWKVDQFLLLRNGKSFAYITNHCPLLHFAVISLENNDLKGD